MIGESMTEVEAVASREHQRRLRDWINKIEERIEKLLDFDIAELTGAEREVAASRLLVTLGRMIELEQQLAQDAGAVIPSDDDVKYIARVIDGSVTPPISPADR